MKFAILLVLVLVLAAVHGVAADTNLSQSITVERPLEDVIGAMQTYYSSTNYHGFAYAVCGTNAVPGVSYSLRLADCAFSASLGVLDGDMVATRATEKSTKLELVVRNDVPTDPKAAASFKRTISKTLEQVAKIAESKR